MLVARLLCVWALVSYGLGIFLVEPLNTIRIGGFPLGFWFDTTMKIGVLSIIASLAITVASAWAQAISSAKNKRRKSSE